MSQLLNHCPDAVLEDVAEHGLAPLAAYFDRVLTLAADQPIGLDALGCETALCGCGQFTWMKGADRWELMDGTPHRHPRVDNNMTYTAMAAAWGHVPKPRPWQARYAGELG